MFRIYNFVKKVAIMDDGIKIITVGDLSFYIPYDNFGLIDKCKGLKIDHYYTYEYPFVTVVYYNQQLNKCFEIFFDRKVGEMIVTNYLQYCKKKGIKPAPILEGFVETSDIERKAVSKIKRSSFCHRGNRNVR